MSEESDPEHIVIVQEPEQDAPLSESSPDEEDSDNLSSSSSSSSSESSSKESEQESDEDPRGPLKKRNLGQ